MAQSQIVPDTSTVAVELPAPVLASKHIGIIPVVPYLTPTAAQTLIQKIRRWLS